MPKSACAMPTEHRMKYFHAASRLAGVRYSDTRSTVESVAASIATQHADVVRHERKQHREGEQLVHAVIEAQPRAGDALVHELYAHVRSRKERRGERDEGRQRDQEHVERIDEYLLVERCERPFGDDPRRKRGGCSERGEAHHRIHLRRPRPVAEEREQRGAEQGNAEEQPDFDHASFSINLP